MSRTVTSPFCVDAERLADDRLFGRNFDAGEGSLVDTGAGSVGSRDGLQDDLRCGSTVDGVGRCRVGTELGLEVGDELGAGAASCDQLRSRETGEGDEHALGLFESLNRRVTGEAVRSDELDGISILVPAEYSYLVTDQLLPVVVVDAAEEDAVGALGLEAFEQRGVVRLLGVP